MLQEYALLNFQWGQQTQGLLVEWINLYCLDASHDEKEGWLLQRGPYGTGGDDTGLLYPSFIYLHSGVLRAQNCSPENTIQYFKH